MRVNARISSEYDEMYSQHHMRGITNLAHNKPTPLPTPEKLRTPKISRIDILLD